MNTLRALRIDHVELFVPDRYQAADWYRRVLGLEIMSEYEPWATDPRGPLMISGDEGVTKLALFEGHSRAPGESTGFHRVAFRADADQFVQFVRRLEELHLTDRRARPVTSRAIVDHQKAYSVYFSDPYGHHLELTTYDYEPVRRALALLREQAR